MKINKDWGRFIQLSFNQPSSVKVIEIEPGKETSFHFHNLRDDLWYILDDGVGIQIKDEVKEAKMGEEFIIPAGTPHRLFCNGEKKVRVLEIAFGFTQEDDKIKVREKSAK